MTHNCFFLVKGHYLFTPKSQLSINLSVPQPACLPDVLKKSYFYTFCLNDSYPTSDAC